MGFFWDLLQQYQIGSQNTRAGSIEERVAGLESELDAAYEFIQKMAGRLDELEDLMQPAVQ